MEAVETLSNGWCAGILSLEESLGGTRTAKDGWRHSTMFRILGFEWERCIRVRLYLVGGPPPKRFGGSCFRR